MFFKIYKIFLTCGICGLFLTGCATTEYSHLPSPVEPSKKVEKKEEGIYHKVQKGQTLWRIAKSYGVNVEDIISANNIPNAAAIEIGQLMLIPGAKEAKEISDVAEVDENKDEFAWPIKGKIISYFNDRLGFGTNRGIDIMTNPTEIVKASRQGTVILADHMAGYNKTVMVDHGDNFISVYANNSKLLVKAGDRVSKGDSLAESGSFANKSFLHFEIRKGKEATNPLYYLQ